MARLRTVRHPGSDRAQTPGSAHAVMRTDVGVVRENNEDAALVDHERQFFVVADGMGGHSAGDVASALAVAAVRTTLIEAEAECEALAASTEDDREQRMRELLERAMRAANHAVLEHSQRDRHTHGMGTTLEIVAIVGGQAFVAHVGDSRTYLVRDGGTRQETFDHTVAQVMRRAGTLSPEEAEVSPMRSVLSNAIGISPQLTIDHSTIELRVGDRLLLCTDGLYDYFATDELSAALANRTAASALDTLIEGARNRGGADNITGIIVEVAEAAAPLELDDDDPTTPISVPVDTPPQPLSGVGDGVVSALVEQALRESSQPYEID